MACCLQTPDFGPKSDVVLLTILRLSHVAREGISSQLKSTTGFAMPSISGIPGAEVVRSLLTCGTERGAYTA